MSKDQPLTDPQKKYASLKDWRKKNKLTLQIAALFFGAAAPFGLYAALQTQQPLLAGFSFGLVTVSMLLVLWTG